VESKSNINKHAAVLFWHGKAITFVAGICLPLATLPEDNSIYLIETALSDLCLIRWLPAIGGLLLNNIETANGRGTSPASGRQRSTPILQDTIFI
jgi:hypothetical protein